jgi:hypothetical protein
MGEGTNQAISHDVLVRARDCRVGADRIVRVQISPDSKVVSQAFGSCTRDLAGQGAVRTCVHEVGIGVPLKGRVWLVCEGLELGRMPEALDLAQPAHQWFQLVKIRLTTSKSLILND